MLLHDLEIFSEDNVLKLSFLHCPNIEQQSSSGTFVKFR